MIHYSHGENHKEDTFPKLEKAKQEMKKYLGL